VCSVFELSIGYVGGMSSDARKSGIRCHPQRTYCSAEWGRVGLQEEAKDEAGIYQLNTHWAVK